MSRVDDLVNDYVNKKWLTGVVTLVIKDNQDMTMQVTVIGITDTFIREMVSNGLVVPKPEGVGITYVFANSYVFGYGPETNIVKGYGQGEWV